MIGSYGHPGEDHRNWMRVGTLAAAVATAVLLAGCAPPPSAAVDATPSVPEETIVETARETTQPAAESSGEATTAPPVEPPTAAMVHSSGTQVLGPDDEPLNLRCTNVDGWLTPTPYLVSDAGNALFTSPAEFASRLDDVVGEDRAAEFWAEWRENFITEADFERMSALGFNCARLIIYYRAIASVDSGEVVFDEAGLSYVDAAIEWGERHGVYVVLDLHAAPGGQNPISTVSDVPSWDPVARLWEGPETAANQDATVAIWRALAERYALEQWVAGYDLLNEPDLPLGSSGSELVDLYARIIAAIRSVDSNHMVIIEGDKLASDFSMFTEPLDDNMMYEFHAYDLTGFSEWSTPGTENIQPYLDLREAHDRPLWLGEFGEGSQDWISEMVELMESNDIGWALYPWKRKQTWFWNPVVQRIDDMPSWYVLAGYLAQPPNSSVPVPSLADAEEGMAEVLSKVQLANNSEDGGLVSAILSP